MNFSQAKAKAVAQKRLAEFGTLLSNWTQRVFPQLSKKKVLHENPDDLVEFNKNFPIVHSDFFYFNSPEPEPTDSASFNSRAPLTA